MIGETDDNPGKMRLGYHVPRMSDTLYESIVREYDWFSGQEIFRKIRVSFQVFISGPRSFKLHKLPKEDIESLGKFLKEHDILLVVHGTYLDRPFNKDSQGSVKSIVGQLQVIHEINKFAGGRMIGPIIHLSKMSRALQKKDEIRKELIHKVIFETDAYDPLKDGHNEHEGDPLEIVFDDLSDFLGGHGHIVFDTAHIFESGIDLHDPKVMKKFLGKVSNLRDQYDLHVGFHLNDSASPLGSILDRHAPIGSGHIFSGPGGISSLQVIFKYIKDHKLWAILENPIEDIPRAIKYIEKHCL